MVASPIGSAPRRAPGRRRGRRPTVRSRTSSTGTSRSAAMRAPTKVTQAGRLRRPRCGTGARYGLSVSTSSAVERDDSAAASRTSVAPLNVTIPEKLTYGAAIEARRGLVGPAGEAVEDRARRARPRRRGCRTCRPTPRGCGSRAAGRSSWASAICAANAVALHVARRVVVVVVEAALADRDRPLGPSNRSRDRVDAVARPRAGAARRWRGRRRSAAATSSAVERRGRGRSRR